MLNDEIKKKKHKEQPESTDQTYDPSYETGIT
jgi:hypothetical protein